MLGGVPGVAEIYVAKAQATRFGSNMKKTTRGMMKAGWVGFFKRP